MHSINTSHEFDAPADALWEIFEDFAHIERWWPRDESAVQIERVVLEGEGVGQIRHIYNVGFPAPISERLDFLDPASHTLKLSIVGQRPAGLIRYQATGRIENLPDKRCRLHYHSEFTTRSGEPEEARAFLLIAYQLMFKGLGKWCSINLINK